MKKQNSILLLLLLIQLTLAVEVKAHSPYELYMKAVEADLPELEKEKLQLERHDATIDGTHAVYAPRLYASNQLYRVKNNDDFSGNDVATFGSKTVVGVNKMLKSGTEVGSELSLDIYQNRSEMESWRMNEESFELTRFREKYRNRTIQPQLTLKASHALLKNRGGIAEKFAIESATYQKISAEYRAALTKYNALNQYSQEYVQLQKLETDTILLRQIHTKLIAHKARARRMLNAGLLDRDEYARFTVLLLQIDEQISRIAMEIALLQDRLAAYITHDAPPTSLQHLYAEQFQESLESLPFDSTLEGKLFSVLQAEANEYVTLRKNLLSPELSLYGQSGFRHYRNRSKKPEKKKRSDLSITFTVGAQFSMPIGNKKAKSELKEAKLTSQMVSKEREISIKRYSRNLQNLQTTHEQLQILITKKEALIAALKTKAQAEYRKFRQARMDLSELLDTQTSILEAQMALNSYRAELITTLITYKTVTQ